MKTYTELPYEDRVLIDGLFQSKEKTKEDRAIVRDIIADLKRLEAKMTKEILNLSKSKIAEKFDISHHTARPMKAIERGNPDYVFVKNTGKKHPNKIQKKILKKIAEKGQILGISAL